MRRTFWQSHSRGFYFRILGYGLSFNRDKPPGFGERMGVQRVLRVGRWAVEWLSARYLPRI